jgi:hypothetical protein
VTVLLPTDIPTTCRRDLNSLSGSRTRSYRRRSSKWARFRHLFEPKRQAEKQHKLLLLKEKQLAANQCRELLDFKSGRLDLNQRPLGPENSASNTEKNEIPGGNATYTLPDLNRIVENSRLAGLFVSVSARGVPSRGRRALSEPETSPGAGQMVPGQAASPVLPRLP